MEENETAFVGGTDLIQKIMDDEIQSDFYVVVPEIMSELNPLKKKLGVAVGVGEDLLSLLEIPLAVTSSKCLNYLKLDMKLR